MYFVQPSRCQCTEMTSDLCLLVNKHEKETSPVPHIPGFSWADSTQRKWLLTAPGSHKQGSPASATDGSVFRCPRRHPLPVCRLAPSGVQLYLSVCLQGLAPPSVLQHGQRSASALQRLLPHRQQANSARLVTLGHELSPASLFAPSCTNPAAEVLDRSGANVHAASVVLSSRSNNCGIVALRDPHPAGPKSPLLPEARSQELRGVKPQ